ncbi:UNVERIFIED_CONTAM: hypothetical protein GTU68_020861 [Idotea baltica]|nr:hypothetical protein [Idotea baltica]
MVQYNHLTLKLAIPLSSLKATALKLKRSTAKKSDHV